MTTSDEMRDLILRRPQELEHGQLRIIGDDDAVRHFIAACNPNDGSIQVNRHGWCFMGVEVLQISRDCRPMQLHLVSVVGTVAR